MVCKFVIVRLRKLPVAGTQRAKGGAQRGGQMMTRKSGSLCGGCGVVLTAAGELQR